MMRSKSGYSLVELMVVVSIMAIVGGFALANFVKQAPFRRLEDAQWRIMSDLRAARMAAVTKSANVRVTFNSSSKNYTIWTDANRNGSVDTGEQVTESLSDIKGLSFSSYPSVGTFNAGGGWDSSYYYLYVSLFVTDAGYKYVYVFPSGEVDRYN